METPSGNYAQSSELDVRHHTGGVLSSNHLSFSLHLASGVQFAQLWAMLFDSSKAMQALFHSPARSSVLRVLKRFRCTLPRLYSRLEFDG
mmetsp:Transcript_114220/g.319145  ORF Transcript_114220/g.319145 Transcript_114220/m.319145 type:complete len:90 (+) Transcript_114220:147-416(+)